MGLREDYQTLTEKQINEWKAHTERFKAGAEVKAAIERMTTNFKQ